MYQYNEVVVHVYSSSVLVNRGSSICVKQSCTSKTRKYNRCIVALYQYTEVVVQMYRRTVLVYRGSSTKYMCTVALYLYTEVQYTCTVDLYQYTKIVVQVYTRYLLVHRFTEIVVHVFSIHIYLLVHRGSSTGVQQILLPSIIPRTSPRQQVQADRKLYSSASRTLIPEFNNT